MRKILVALVVIFPLLLHAQKKQGREYIDSLEAELKPERYSKISDTTKVRILGNLADEIRTTNPGKGIKYSWQAIKLAEDMKWAEGIGYGYSTLAICHFAKSEDSAGLAYAFKAIALLEESGSKTPMAACLGNIAAHYSSVGNYSKALDYFFRSLKINEELNFKESIGRDLLNIGIVYLMTGKYAKANEYFLRSVAIREELNDKSGLANCFTNLGNSYASMGDNAKALEYTLKALHLYEELGNTYGIQASLANAGDTYLSLGDIPKALEFEFKALKMSDELDNKPNIAAITDMIGGIYLTIAKDTTGKIPEHELIPRGKAACLAKAIMYFERSVAVGKEINDMNSYLPVLKHLTEAYNLSGNFQMAFTYQQMYMQTKDSVFNLENNMKIGNLETLREKELKEKQIIIDTLAVEKKRNERVFYIIGIGLLLVVVGIIARYYRKQLITNRLLNEEKVRSDGLMVDLNESLKQKDVLMKEIHHRVKNNLQLISALLDLQLDVAQETSKDAMTESAMRVRSISLIHQQLYQNEDITTIEFSQFVQDMMRHLSSAFTRPGQHIALESNIPEIMFDIDTAVPLGLILNELMTNSYKYAFGSNEGFIRVNLTGKGDNYELLYADSGPGMPDNYDIDMSDSLGLRVIRGLSGQLGGSMTYDMQKRQFVITFIP